MAIPRGLARRMTAGEAENAVNLLALTRAIRDQLVCGGEPLSHR
jgi:hypothetical protein